MVIWFIKKELLMDRNGIGYIILAGLLVFGLFAYANFDQTKLATAKTKATVMLEREPAPVQAAENLVMTVSAKVIAGTLTSLIVAACILAYQQARINALRSGGWERFWERRRMPKGEASPKKPSMMDLMTMIWTDELLKRRKQ
jgi:hypothetical protein